VDLRVVTVVGERVVERERLAIDRDRARDAVRVRHAAQRAEVVVLDHELLALDNHEREGRAVEQVRPAQRVQLARDRGQL